MQLNAIVSPAVIRRRAAAAASQQMSSQATSLAVQLDTAKRFEIHQPQTSSIDSRKRCELNGKHTVPVSFVDNVRA